MIASVLAAIEDESDRDYMLWLYEEFHRLMFVQARRYASECCEDIVQARYWSENGVQTLLLTRDDVFVVLESNALDRDMLIQVAEGLEY